MDITIHATKTKETRLCVLFFHFKQGTCQSQATMTNRRHDIEASIRSSSWNGVMDDAAGVGGLKTP